MADKKKADKKAAKKVMKRSESKHIIVGDTVKIISGDHKGETAKVTRVLPAEHKAVLDKFCDIERHLSKRAAQANGGSSKKTVFRGIDLSNLKKEAK